MASFKARRAVAELAVDIPPKAAERDVEFFTLIFASHCQWPKALSMGTLFVAAHRDQPRRLPRDLH